MISGWNENDGALFVGEVPSYFADRSKLVPYLAAQYGKFTTELALKAVSLYPEDDAQFVAAGKAFPSVPVDWFRASQMIRDSQYTCPSLLQTQAASCASGRVLPGTIAAPITVIHGQGDASQHAE